MAVNKPRIGFVGFVGFVGLGIMGTAISQVGHGLEF